MSSMKEAVPGFDLMGCKVRFLQPRMSPGDGTEQFYTLRCRNLGLG
ncbi:MAG TPA: hypothetical protein PK020_06405 [Ilumatobacteraceae bacterium]|mgnify:CR=1 FL=1|nr:hypothetical protein [Ilumatobacteraceae bacterium]HRB04402.1 hypothetical protein [Ilumatobacteraceae bacterium]